MQSWLPTRVIMTITDVTQLSRRQLVFLILAAFPSSVTAAQRQQEKSNINDLLMNLPRSSKDRKGIYLQ